MEQEGNGTMFFKCWNKRIWYSEKIIFRREKENKTLSYERKLRGYCQSIYPKGLDERSSLNRKDKRRKLNKPEKKNGKSQNVGNYKKTFHFLLSFQKYVWQSKNYNIVLRDSNCMKRKYLTQLYCKWQLA